MSVPLSDEQKAKRVNHFKRIIKYRSWFGWLFSIVGAVLFGVGVKQNQDPMVMLNGFLFLATGALWCGKQKGQRRNWKRTLYKSYLIPSIPEGEGDLDQANRTPQNKLPSVSMEESNLVNPAWIF